MSNTAEKSEKRIAAAAQALIEELLAAGHPAAAALQQSWIVDQVLQGRLTANEASIRASIPIEVLHSWLARRNVVSEPEAPSAGITVLMPIYNEEENIKELYERLRRALDPVITYELLFINNGSNDRSGELLSALRQHDSRVKILTLSRNFGHQGAVTAGLDYCRGRAVVVMDGDLQDPPEVVPEMIARWQEGFDVVYAVRQKRKENAVRRGAYYLFYRMLRWLSNIDIPLDAGDFCLMDKRVVTALRQLPERNRFTRGLRVWVGYRHVSLPYERAARYGGESKYSWGDYFRFAIDGILAFSAFPLRLATYLGFASFFLGILYLVYALYSWWTDGEIPRGWTSSIALILFMGGSQLFVLGMLGEYIARIYDESKRRPVYIVSEFLD